MANYLVQDTTLTAIADAIREKGGTSDTIAFNAMAEAIAAIESGGGGISAWGTITPSSYTDSIATGVEIPNDNFYFAIVTISQPTGTSMNYMRCGYFVVQDSITSGLLLSAANTMANVVNSPVTNDVNIVINRTDNTITFKTKGGSAPTYLEGGITFAWFMGGIA